MESDRDLIVWQRAIQMTLAVYNVTSHFPKEDFYGLAGMMRRSSIAVATRIAEGYGRTTAGEYKHLRGMARGPNLEFQIMLVIVSSLSYVEPSRVDELGDLSTEVSKMLHSLIQKL